MAGSPIPYFPVCNAPQNISVAQQTASSFAVSWEGDASLYKLAWKREEDEEWNTMYKNGPGSSGGSGYRTDSLPDGDLAASFSITSVQPGGFDLRIINRCADGSDYTERRKFYLEAVVPPITGLRLVKQTDMEITVGWDELPINGGNPTVVNWCRVDPLGAKINCEAAQVAPEITQYKILFPIGDRLMIFVANDSGGGAIQYSDPLYVAQCLCGGKAPAVGGGEPAVGGDNYRHEQLTPSTVWVINHGLGYYPDVETTDLSGKSLGGVVQYIDENTLEVHFNSPRAGYGNAS